MKSHLEKWEGSFEYNGDEMNDLRDFNPEDGEKFEIILIPRPMIRCKNCQWFENPMQGIYKCFHTNDGVDEDVDGRDVSPDILHTCTKYLEVR